MTQVQPIRGRLSVEEREQIGSLAECGLNSGEIARQLHRAGTTINFHMAPNGLREMTRRADERLRSTA